MPCHAVQQTIERRRGRRGYPSPRESRGGTCFCMACSGHGFPILHGYRDVFDVADSSVLAALKTFNRPTIYLYVVLYFALLGVVFHLVT